MAIPPDKPPLRKEPLLRQVQAKQPPPSRWRKILKTLVRPWALFAEIVSVAAALLVFFEVYIQTIPVIDVSGQSSVGPFVIKNESNFFDMTDNGFSCGIAFVSYDIGNGKWVGFGGTIFGPTQSAPMIHRHGGVIDYRCRASDYLHKNIWGDLCIGMPSACPDAKQSFKTSYMCVWVAVAYRTFFGWWPRHINSEIFAWNGKRWRKGLVAGQRTAEDICGIVSDFPEK